MIVRDEEDFLAQAINSVKSIVSEIIVVDTGSQDRTVEIARSLGAQVFHSPWTNDFSTPRNLSLEKANCDWILVLDADEAIAECDLPDLQRLTLHRDLCWEFLQRHYTDDHRLSGFRPCTKEYPEWEKNYGGFFTSNLCRLFPNHEGLKYEGRIHELVEHSISRLGKHKILRTRIPLHHYGHTSEVKKKKDKSQLYTPLGETKASEAPSAWKNHFEIAVEHNCSGRYQESVSSFQKAVELNPNYEPAWTNMGYVLCELGRYQEALDALKHSLALNPQCAEARCNAAVVFMRNGRWQQAIPHLLEALRCKPDYVNAHCNLGQCLICLHRDQEARQVLERALQLHPHNGTAQADLGVVYLNLGLLEQAKQILQNALQNAPQLARAYYYLGEVCKKKGEATLAIEAFQKFIALEESNPSQKVTPDTPAFLQKLRDECQLLAQSLPAGSVRPGI